MVSSLASSKRSLAMLEEKPGVRKEPALPASVSFASRLREHGLSLLARDALRTLQVNVGKRCNQACQHCHVEAGPKRIEVMQPYVAKRIAWLIERSTSLQSLDLTGGAPELNPSFRFLVTSARQRGLEVIDRCNLTVLFEPEMEDLAEFLADKQVQVVASLPCYEMSNVEEQRGKGVFGTSIAGLRRLNALGYGHAGSGRLLDLVYNPLGATLPPQQQELEAQYKRKLYEHFGIVFNRLFTITNMPIKRFRHQLERDETLAEYMELLVQSFNASTADSLMCRSMLSVGWDGVLYDCDFNQMLELDLLPQRQTIWDIDTFDTLLNTAVATGAHCFGCTAGAGSSCGGVLEGAQVL